MKDQTKTQSTCPDAAQVLRGLKDFQRDTVEYVFRRLYTDPDATNRFLIADEVGLGKTLVARGLIARAIEHLWDKVDRVDIIYICSNADIARQNINRLRIAGSADFAMATRLTLLPITVKNLRQNRLNFISFTPGTSLDLKSNLGLAEERALLYWLLDHAWGMDGVAPTKVLRGRMSRDNFENLVQYLRKEYTIDPTLADAFADALNHEATIAQQQGYHSLHERFDALCDSWRYLRSDPPTAEKQERSYLVGELRGLLAETCISALEPDLIILDEFQRFKHLLNDDEEQDEVNYLAHRLFEYSDAQSATRVVLLSATPYKMYTLSHEQEENHYEDFLRTISFLHRDDAATFAQLIQDYRRELFRLKHRDGTHLFDLKTQLETNLRRVMVRTERLASSADRNGMLIEMSCPDAQLAAHDLFAYLSLQQIARLLGHHDTLEYWKSSPYLLNFMDEYKLKQLLKSDELPPAYEAALAQTCADGNALLLPWHEIVAYAEIDPGNARLRSLLADTIGHGTWQLLWIPPSLPYYQPAGVYADPQVAGCTKRLIFSAWRVVPKMIATLVSYEAERHIIEQFEPVSEQRPGVRERLRPLLRFARTDGRLTGMPVLALMYPCVTLARYGDPLELVRTGGSPDSLPTLEDMLERIRAALAPLVDEIITQQNPPTHGAEDENWYWAALLLLDLHTNPQQTREWFGDSHLAAIWSNEGARDTSSDDDEHGLWAAHVSRAQQLIQGNSRLGRPPADLLDVLAQMALSAPGTVALRALSRAGGTSLLSELVVRDNAAIIGWYYRSLFNRPEVIALLRGLDRAEPYWRRVLDYCAAGNIQAVLDEYVHVLGESLGFMDSTPVDRTEALTEAIITALDLRTAVLSVDDIQPTDDRDSITIERRRMRNHFALRFGDERHDTETTESRKEQVRDAFNSPFWPFVLATTSVGQEGLDFHTYCHAVVHWNLPSNPVDLEQREGRVHRYKGHAVRKNIACDRGSRTLSTSASGEWSDPWQELFAGAMRDRAQDALDLVPFWMYPLEGGARIERYVPALPLSRDLQRLADVRQALTLYRMVFGQARQEDVLDYLRTHLSEVEVQEIAERLSINLEPPHAHQSLPIDGA